MVDRSKDTDFLKWLIGFGEPEQCEQLRERIHQVQREEYHVRRTTVLMCVLLLISLTGLFYATVFVPEWLGRSLPWMIRGFCALGSSAAISLLVCLGCWLRLRNRLNNLHEQCRDAIREILLTRLNGVPNVDAPEFRASQYRPAVEKLPMAS